MADAQDRLSAEDREASGAEPRGGALRDQAGDRRAGIDARACARSACSRRWSPSDRGCSRPGEDARDQDHGVGARRLVRAAIQFTPDLVPADLVGTRIYRPDKRRRSTPSSGPVFCNFLLADEINRAPAKVQSRAARGDAGAAGDDRRTRPIPVPEPFLVLATQNPIESEGTYPLPEAQVDRFMLKVLIDYPEHDEELTVVPRSLEPAPRAAQPVLTLDGSDAPCRSAVAKVFVDPALVSWVGRSRHGDAQTRPRSGSTRSRRYIAYGASPRGPISVIAAARALALLRGSATTSCPPMSRRSFAGRVPAPARALSYQALAEEVTADQILDHVLAAVPAAADRPRRGRAAVGVSGLLAAAGRVRTAGAAGAGGDHCREPRRRSNWQSAARRRAARGRLPLQLSPGWGPGFHQVRPYTGR